LFYTVDIKKLFHPLYRLQKNGTWRSIQHDESVTDSDEKLPISVVHQYLFAENLDFTIEGQTYHVNASPADLDLDRLYIEPKLYRAALPIVPIPSREELVDVIESGNDTSNNALILDLEGHFKLLNIDEVDVVENISIAVRNETFEAGNDYVGPAAGKDSSHIENLYLSSLKHWVDHLATGHINIYNDINPPMDSESELLLKLGDVLKKLGLIT